MISKKSRVQERKGPTCGIFGCLEWEQPQPLDFIGFKTPKRSLRKSLSQQFVHFPKKSLNSRPSQQLTPQTQKNLYHNAQSIKNLRFSEKTLGTNSHNDHSIIHYLQSPRGMTRIQSPSTHDLFQYKESIQPVISKIKILNDPNSSNKNKNVETLNFNFANRSSFKAQTKCNTIIYKQNPRVSIETGPKMNMELRNTFTEDDKHFMRKNSGISSQNQNNQSIHRTNSTTFTHMNMKVCEQQKKEQIKSNQNEHKVKPYYQPGEFKDLPIAESKFVTESSITPNKNQSSKFGEEIIKGQKKPLPPYQKAFGQRLVVSFLSSSESDQSIVCETHHNLGNGKIQTLF